MARDTLYSLAACGIESFSLSIKDPAKLVEIRNPTLESLPTTKILPPCHLFPFCFRSNLRLKRVRLSFLLKRQESISLPYPTLVSVKEGEFQLVRYRPLPFLRDRKTPYPGPKLRSLSSRPLKCSVLLGENRFPKLSLFLRSVLFSRFVSSRLLAFRQSDLFFFCGSWPAKFVERSWSPARNCL